MFWGYKLRFFCGNSNPEKNALNCFYKELIFSDIKRHKLRENKFLVSETLFHQYSVFTVLLMAFTTIKLLCNFIFLLDRFFFRWRVNSESELVQYMF